MKNMSEKEVIVSYEGLILATEELSRISMEFEKKYMKKLEEMEEVKKRFEIKLEELDKKVKLYDETIKKQDEKIQL